MHVRGIILGAGSSMRMGRPKALLTVGGTTFLDLVVGAFRAGGVAEIVVVVGGPDRGEIERAAVGVSRVVPNPDPSDGPISSIRAGVAAVVGPEPDAVLVHPVDIPGVEGGDVRSLVTAFSAGAGSSDAQTGLAAIIPSIGGRRGHPVLLSRELAERVLALPKGKSLRNLLSEPGISIGYVESENELLLRDVDTPEEYDALKKSIEGK